MHGQSLKNGFGKGILYVGARGSTGCTVVNRLKNWLSVEKKIFPISETTKPPIG
jgi:hypothetical protein